MRALTVLLAASVLMGGCGSVPPSVDPSVEVWNAQPTADSDLADVIVEEVVSLTSNLLQDAAAETTSYSNAETSARCWLWCSRGRTSGPARAESQPIAAALPVAYYPVHSEPLRPATRVTSSAQPLAIKPTPRPMHVAAPKPQAPSHTAHTSAAKPAMHKPSSKPAATSKSNSKKDKK